ncbi:MAG: leucyl/phenylalanyl-tRNA--protein transferase [Gammaproteobacteria bacterium]|nr:leucyl/phenylalanyl-tRNA--protein transferase [Gammaproteobacteria bacterium]
MVSLVKFPPVTNANSDGLLAMGGDLTTDTLVSAYSQGIFPWFNEGQPVLWWSPDPRMVLYPDEIKISRSLRKTLRQNRFQLSCDTQFAQVMKGCALRGRQREFAAREQTWITDDMHSAYTRLHDQGYAHSIEVWQQDVLVGGLYGVVLGKVFFGESMFSEQANASKVALVALCQYLQQQDFRLIDCQVETDHLVSMGARNISRADFLQQLSDVDISHASPHFAAGFEQSLAEHAINRL